MDLETYPFCETATLNGTVFEDWNQFKAVVEAEEYDKLGRGKISDLRYTQYKMSIINKSNSIEDHLFQKLFGNPRIGSIDEAKIPNVIQKGFLALINRCFFVAVQQIFKDCHVKWNQILKNSLNIPACTNSNDFLILNSCQFPYATPPGVFHAILWSTRSLENQEIDGILKSLIDLDYIYFVNPTRLRSIKTIDHAHVFIKLKDQ